MIAEMVLLCAIGFVAMAWYTVPIEDRSAWWHEYAGWVYLMGAVGISAYLSRLLLLSFPSILDSRIEVGHHFLQ
jgi:hypothetical protein